MPFTVTLEEGKKMATAKKWTADRDLYLDKTKENVVEDGDPGAAFLLCRKGRQVAPDLVERYKLKNKSKAKPKATKKTPNKAVKKGEDK